MDLHMSHIVKKAERPVLLTLALVLGVGSVGWGLSVFLMPAAFDPDAFRVAGTWAAPQAWGVVLMVSGAMTVASGLTAMRTVVWPATALALTYMAVCTSVVLAARTSDPVPTAMWAYLMIGAACATLAFFSAYLTKE